MSGIDTHIIYYVNVGISYKRMEVNMSMYEYYCEYKTKSGQRCGETVYARDSIEAREIIKKRPDFSYLMDSPKKID